MTDTDKIAIVLVIVTAINVIATFFGPMAAILLQSRINQPKDKPDTKKPTKRTQTSKRWVEALAMSDWVPLSGIAFGVVSIVFNLWIAGFGAPISVLAVSFASLTVVYNLVSIRQNEMQRAIWKMSTKLETVSKETTPKKRKSTATHI